MTMQYVKWHCILHSVFKVTFYITILATFGAKLKMKLHHLATFVISYTRFKMHIEKLYKWQN